MAELELPMRETPRAQFENMRDRLIDRKTGRMEDLLRTAITVQMISQHEKVGSFSALDHQILDEMRENVRKNTNQGNLSARKVCHLSIFQAGLQAAFTIAGHPNLGTAAGGFVGAFSTYTSSQEQMRKTAQDHKLQELQIIGNQHREKMASARNQASQEKQFLRQMDQEESQAKTSLYRSS